MKTILTVIMMLTSSICFAGGSGGGGVMASAMMSTNGGGVFIQGNGSGTMEGTEIVYHMGEKDGVVKFAYARLVNNKWEVQRLAVPNSELINDQDAYLAISQSKKSIKWTKIE